MGVPITGMTVFLNQAAAGVSAANTVATNENGSVNLTGTVVGIGQAVQSVVSIATTNIDTKLVPGAGAVLGAEGAYHFSMNILTDINSGKPVQTSDVAGLVSNLAGAAGSAAAVAFLVLPAAAGAAALIVPLTVVSVAAGSVQLIASAEGWTINPSGIASQATLTADQWAQAASQAQALNSNPATLNSALQSVGVNLDDTGTFLVPQTDSNGNVIGYTPETPLSPLQLADNVTQYTFANGVTFKQQPGVVTEPDGTSNILLDPLAQWTVPQSNGIATILNLSANGGYASTVVNSSGVATQELTLGVTSSELNGITSTTQTFSSSLAGTQNSLQNQLTVNGNAASEQTTVFNSDGSVSYTENKSSKETLINEPATGDPAHTARDF